MKVVFTEFDTFSVKAKTETEKTINSRHKMSVVCFRGLYSVYLIDGFCAIIV